MKQSNFLSLTKKGIPTNSNGMTFYFILTYTWSICYHQTLSRKNFAQRFFSFCHYQK